ncbi:hypothetical protein [Pseudomonas sp. RC10]|uniref:hypothetical protein n=1 Tax=Pseudomonas bambusae TaxID=3139142 RepID=UPI003139603E
MDYCGWPMVLKLTQQTSESLVPLATAGMTSIVAATGIYIAYRQWDTNRKKLKLDLFDRRIAVYDATKSALGEIFATGGTSQDLEMRYLAGIAAAQWLFDQALTSFLKEDIWAELVELSRTEGVLHGAPPGEERTKEIQKNREAKHRLIGYFNSLDDRFAKYLRLDH